MAMDPGSQGEQNVVRSVSAQHISDDMSINLPFREAFEIVDPLQPTQNGFEFVDLTDRKLDHDAMILAPGQFALDKQVLPIGFEG